MADDGNDADISTLSPQLYQQIVASGGKVAELQAAANQQAAMAKAIRQGSAGVGDGQTVAQGRLYVKASPIAQFAKQVANVASGYEDQQSAKSQGAAQGAQADINSQLMAAILAQQTGGMQPGQAPVAQAQPVADPSQGMSITPIAPNPQYQPFSLGGGS